MIERVEAVSEDFSQLEDDEKYKEYNGPDYRNN
jgi:hypothetical protein